MRIHTVFLITLLALISPAMAANDSTQDAFARLNHCIQQGTEDCHNLITTGSAPLYNRLNADGLMSCVPKDAAYISQEPAGNEIIVRASTAAGGKQRIMRLHFVQEQGAWKLDIPASLQAGMGDGWQQKVDMTEQVYLSIRKMGGQMDCSILQSMVRNSH